MSNKNFFLDKPVRKRSNEALHTRFRTLLLERKMKQQELADAVGISKSHMSEIIWGKIIPTITLRLKIASALNVDTSVIWSDLENG